MSNLVPSVHVVGAWEMWPLLCYATDADTTIYKITVVFNKPLIYWLIYINSLNQSF